MNQPMTIETDLEVTIEDIEEVDDGFLEDLRSRASSFFDNLIAKLELELFEEDHHV